MDYSNDYGGGGGGYNEYDNQMGGQQMGGGQYAGGHIARPRVDIEASGEVDPNLYPQPKEATNKIRGKSDVLEMFCGSVDQELLPVKSFYFFFYAAFGSLFPLMGIYFKQMGMNPGQCGILIGMRPFVEFLSAPFWGSYADRCKQGKKLLLASLTCWVVFTLPLGFIQPEAVKCMVQKNSTTYVLETTKISKRDLRAVEQLELNEDFSNISNNENQLFNISVNISASDFISYGNGTFKLDNSTEYDASNRKIARERRSIIGISPLKVNIASNYDHLIHKDYIRPIFSSMVYRTADVQKAFFLLLLVVLIGEFFSAPAITLADSAVITLLGDDADKYGHQRMFGSLGWGLSMFFVGIALDHSTSFPDHPCGPERQEKNYTICFATFSVLMTAAIITASQITFKYVPEQDQPQQTNIIDQNKQNAEDEMQNQLAAQLQLPSLAVGGGSLPSVPLETDIGAQSKMFAQTTRQMPEWVTVLQHFKDLKCAAFLFVAWFMGFGIGLIFTFLFWHLQDYGGSPTLFGVASVINHISEIFAYFFSFRLITQIGHVKVLCLGLIGNIVRFLYISWLRNPWWVLPFEFMQGITHAAVWAACCSYIAHNTPQHLRASSQGVLQGIHHGLGRGCGAVIGGMFVSYFGTTSTFRGYGIVCIFVLAGFIFINFYRKEQGFISEIPITEDPHQVAEETSHLAPHGVPSNPIPRALSSQRLNEINNGQYGTYQTSAGGNLDIPGGNTQNPFLQQ